INIVGSYDVDENKIGKSIFDIAIRYFDKNIISDSLRKIKVREGLHLGNLDKLNIPARGLEEKMSLSDAINFLINEWKKLKPDVLINIITTEETKPIKSFGELEEYIFYNRKDRVNASYAYMYAAIKYASQVKPIAFINAIPTPLANNVYIVRECYKNDVTLFGDDGATGATPLTADILEHMAERNRRVKGIVQFNIGGNTDFYALTNEDKNRAKEYTKSSIVKDILGYSVPTYIKPTGFLESLGDKKFVSMHIEYETFNGFIDEVIINARINDSPALAGLLIDLIRLGYIALKSEIYGTVYEVNAFFMKKPGPPNSKSISKIKAYQILLQWINRVLRKRKVNVIVKPDT
ncbi:MAG TPA: myo-inositol-1-phosphate synthase, partial [Thermoprotei archaeon]|nr:myo-inositol-1-phosphate synthase [Thermoprotei archaeon]